MNLEINKIVVGQVESNCYIVSFKNKGFIIDPGGGFSKIEKYLKNKKIKPLFILNTHGHYDHILSNNDIINKYKIPLWIHKKDNFMLEEPEKNLSFYMGTPFKSKKADILLHDGYKFEFLNTTWRVLHTPGHTDGSIVIFNKQNQIMFTGDTLFAEGWGRTDFPGGSRSQIKKSLKKLFCFDDDYRCYPGHGNSFVLGEKIGLIRKMLDSY